MVRVRTRYGVVEGIREQGICSFLGVPYAKPPAGELRFRPPQEPEAWEGVLDCTHFGAPGLQLITDNHVTTERVLGISSEDCLYLNIRTKDPSPDAKLPVYVFIHGGAFETGGSNMKLYEGKGFAEDGIVYVNINYRLGPFGALALASLREEEGITGCYQILDIMQAVRWVHENIREFGGDPDCITIGGESAGAFAVSVLMCMPQMKGMFRRCILESGSIRAAATSVHYGHGNPQIALENSRSVLEDLGLSDSPEDLKRLRSIPGEEILKAWYFKKDGSLRLFRSNPVLDGLLFEGDQVPDPAKQAPADVDLLFGFNTHEGSMFVSRNLTKQQYVQELANMFPEHWQEVWKQYPAEGETEPFQQLSEIYGLQKFKGSMLPYADLLADRGNGVYAYHFDYLTDLMKKEGLGVRHIAELHFVFHSFLGVVGADDPEGNETAALMHRAWSEFIRRGNPGNGWKPYDSKHRGTMRFSKDEMVFESMGRAHEMLWLDSLL